MGAGAGPVPLAVEVTSFDIDFMTEVRYYSPKSRDELGLQGPDCVCGDPDVYEYVEISGEYGRSTRAPSPTRHARLTENHPAHSGDYTRPKHEATQRQRRPLPFSSLPEFFASGNGKGVGGRGRLLARCHIGVGGRNNSGTKAEPR